MSKLTSKPDFVSLEPGFSFGGPLHQIIPSQLLLKQALPLPSVEGGTDRYWMLEAMRESTKGIGISNPNPAVGCILVDSHGQEISRGATQAYTGLHAEGVAFQQIRQDKKKLARLEGASAYVTLEPCSHVGNQPPCVDLFLSSPVRRIVIAREDPNPRVNGQGISKLKAAGKELETGVFTNEATAWNFPFFAYQKLQRPVFILKWAQTVDGQLADDSGSSQWISGPIARAYTHWIRQRYDAILVGAKTVLADSPSLTARDCNPPHQAQPLPIILDPHGICLELSDDRIAKLSEKTFSDRRSIIFVTTQASLNRHRSSWITKRSNVTVLTLNTGGIIEELVSLLAGSEIQNRLGHPLQSVFVEGGPKTLSSFLKAGYGDLLHIFTAPLFTGGSQNRVSLEKLLPNGPRYKLVSHCRLGDDVLMELVSPATYSLFSAAD